MKVHRVDTIRVRFQFDGFLLWPARIKCPEKKLTVGCRSADVRGKGWDAADVWVKRYVTKFHLGFKLCYLLSKTLRITGIFGIPNPPLPP